MIKMNLREEIYEELGNLAEFGEQESKTEIILKLIEKRIDELLLDNRRVLQNLIESGHFKQEDSSAIVRLTSKIDAYVGIKEMLK